ncbi:MAG: hypothetical protein KF729_00845 [Sandaracinaceae bacterium]|nr:hypothetical protein [Sandaracinaceae bacterium]
MHAHLPAPAVTLATLTGPLTVGPPRRVGQLTLVPILGPTRAPLYRTLSEVLEHGGVLRERPSPDVNCLLLDAPPGPPVLLYAGEEVVGAKQNRVLNVTWLVAGDATHEVPVSCIERGRWTHGAERDGRFASSPQVAYTGLRRHMDAMSSSSVRAADRRSAIDQCAVWQDVEHRSRVLEVRSRTGAMTDAFEARRESVEAIASQSAVTSGQRGLLAWIGDRFLALDLVSSEAAWARMHDRIVRGHALEALASAPIARPSPDAAAVLEALLAAPVSLAPAEAGLGEAVSAQLVEPPIAVNGLALDGELVQLSAFERS